MHVVWFLSSILLAVKSLHNYQTEPFGSYKNLSGLDKGTFTCGDRLTGLTNASVAYFHFFELNGISNDLSMTVSSCNRVCDYDTGLALWTASQGDDGDTVWRQIEDNDDASPECGIDMYLSALNQQFIQSDKTYYCVYVYSKFPNKIYVSAYI